MNNLRAFSRKGGQVRSPRKTRANRAKATAYWEAVRAGKLVGPRRYRKPPTVEEIQRKLAPFCGRHGILTLEIFGSIARGEASVGSDVDMIATFKKSPGLAFFGMEAEMSRLLGVPVHLLTRESVNLMSNPFRRALIFADARVIYHANTAPR